MRRPHGSSFSSSASTVRVLYVTLFDPNDQTFGAGVRNHAIVDALAARYDLHVAVATTEAGAATWRMALADRSFTCHRLAPALTWPAAGGPRPHASELGRGAFGPAFTRLCAQLQPDILWFYQKYPLRTVGYRMPAPAVVDFDEVTWRKHWLATQVAQPAYRPYLLAKTLFNSAEDHWIAQRAQAVTLSNPGEFGWLKTRRAKVLLPNGFSFPPVFPAERRPRPRILFLGSLCYHPNIDGLNWFCREVWPQLLTQAPDAWLDVVGRYDERTAALADLPHVTRHGFVPDLAPILARSALSIAPLRIVTGTRIKILESWANGLPVVSTTAGAEGLDARHGQNVLLAESAEDFAAACVELLSNPDLGRRLAFDAFIQGQRTYDWRAITAVVDRVVQIAARDRQGS
jgi:glycosyltransferase involved in cell wall biosynthesis